MSDAFLNELRQDCLKDPDGVFASIEEAVGSVKNQSQSALKDIMKGLHTLKGNLQAVGLVHCGRFVHDLESGIDRVNAALLKTRPSESDLTMLEFLLSDALTTLKEYFEFLAKNPGASDTEAAMVSRLMPVELINNWTPDGVDGGQVELVVAGAATPVEPAATPVEPVVALANGPESPAAGAPVAASPEEPPLVPVQSQATPSASEVPPVAAPIQAHYLLCQKTNASGLSSRFAIPVRYITEVVKAAELSPLPGAHPKVVGLMNLRGEPIPICKMPDFPRDSLSLRDNQLVALIRVKSELFGIVVDGADEIQVLDPETFQKPEALGTSTVEETWLRHLTKLDGQTVMIFDLEAA